MRHGRRSLGAVLLTLGFFTLALLLAAPTISPVGEAAALAAAPAKDLAHAAADELPPSRPTGLRPCPVPLAANPTGYASICWNPSSDNVGIARYDLYRLTVDGFVHASSTTGTVGGFSGELHRMYTMYVVAVDPAGNVSRPSVLISVPATLGMSPTSTPTFDPGDRQPPTKPGGLREPCLQDYRGVSFCWDPSSDNVAVTAYDVYRETETTYLKVGTILPPVLHFAESGLVTGHRYTYVVVARDEAGNLSTPSDPLSALSREGLPSPTVSPTPGVSCAVSYRAPTWGSRLYAEITVRNTGTAAVDGWSLTVAYPESATLRLTSGWAADWTQAGTRLTGTNKGWNKVIRAGSATQVGFAATYSGSAPAPVSFALNGTSCTVAG
ncbi:hypothetical protein HII36_16235 [Nonomuraea sp. NN258]|uniref:cellulose binding domain-containing protein n=1 Tax=Nonomuraea antri TaxID=2730852 RepID=UPI00156A299D|nr:cellulose binding domain-containing protein [Nonomuraea antri]NRQ33384.1 hypothetical protein [Nonomuraea antri]